MLITGKIRIAIVGIGGVGGYFGGLLAKKYVMSDAVEIAFLARGKHLDKIKRDGLRVIKGSDEFIATPSLATSSPADIGKVNAVLFCTKSYDLETAAEQIRPCVDKDTVLLPLMNGVDAADRIRAILPGGITLEGCVYVVSRIREPGVVENLGNVQTLYFGPNDPTGNTFSWLERIFKDAGIETTLSDQISTILWEKFIFISPIATATSLFDSSIGKVIEENELTLAKMVGEVSQIARARGIAIDHEIEGKTMKRLKSFPYEVTSSMHRDYLNDKPKTEFDTLTGFVVTEGKRLHVRTPEYDRASKILSNKKLT